MLLYRSPQYAGALAVDDRHILDAHHQAAVQKAVYLHQPLVACHPADVQLGACFPFGVAGATGAGAAHGLLFLGGLGGVLRQTQLLRGALHLHVPQLDLIRSAFIGACNDRALPVDGGHRYGVALPQRPRQMILFRLALLYRVGGVPQLLDAPVVALTHRRHLLAEIRLVLLLFQLLQLIKEQVGAAAGALHQSAGGIPGVGLQLFHGGLVRLGLLFHLRPQAVGFAPRSLGGSHFVFQLLPGAFQLAYHVLKAGIFGGNHALGFVNDLLRQPQPPADGKGIAAPRHADEQPVGGGKGRHIKFAAAVFHAGGLQGVHLHLGVMGGGRQPYPPLPQRRNDGNRQRRTLGGVGAGTQFVGQHQAVVVGNFQDLNDFYNVRRKGGKALLDALLIADIRQHMGKDSRTAAACHRQHHAAGRHQRQKPQRFECNRFTAGIRPGDDQRIKAIAQPDIHRHHLILLDQRVPCLAKFNDAVLVELRHRRLHFIGQTAFGEQKIQLQKRLKARPGGIRHLPDALAEFLQNTVDLQLLLVLQQPDLIIGIHHRHRLDKDRRAAGGGIVHQTLDLIFTFDFDRHHKPPVPHGDDRLLQRLGILRRPDDAVQLFPYL